MSRKPMKQEQINEVTEKIIDLLKGMPVQTALEILRVTENKMLYLATVGRPGDDLLERQVDLEEVIARKSDQRMAVA